MMNFVVFSELFSWLSKSKIKAGDGLREGRYPFYTSSSQQTKWVNKPLHSTEAIIFGTGGSANLHYVNGEFGVSTECVVAQKKEHVDINVKYVFYFLRANMVLLEMGFRGAGLKHISKSYINNINIPILKRDEQDRIVVTLDKVQSLIDKRDKTIAKLDELILSIYLTMFGRANSDFDKWAEIEIASYKKDKHNSIRTGPFGSSLKHDVFKEQGDVIVLGIDNAVENIFRINKKRYITINQYDSFRNYTVFSRDVIITMMGTVGRSAVIPNDIGIAINTKHIAAITVDESKCNPYYLSFSIHSNPYIQEQIKARSRGAVMDGLNLTIIKQIKIKDAPIALQNEFESRYIKMLKYKNQLYDSRQLLDSLMRSLFQRTLRFKDSLEIDVDLDALIKNIDLIDIESNDITKIKKDIVYTDRLVERIEEQQFDDICQYERAKYVLFQLIKEGIVNQHYSFTIKSVKLSKRQ